jgi:putative transposase
MLAKGRAKVLFATVSQHMGRWFACLNVEAAELHPVHRDAAEADDCRDWIGVDRGLSTFVVAAAANGAEVARVAEWPKAVTRGLQKQRRLAKSLSRKQKGSRNRIEAAARLGGTTTRSPTFADTFCTRSPTRWSRTTTASFLRTST